jgi:hypothetical protein
VQATTAGDHGGSPVAGLKSIWGTVDQHVQDFGVWHFVVVANVKSTADSLTARFSDELKDVTFGRQKIHMEAWGCVL